MSNPLPSDPVVEAGLPPEAQELARLSREVLRFDETDRSYKRDVAHGRFIQATRDPRSLAATVLALLDALSSKSVRVKELERDKRRLDFLDEANRRLNAKYGTTYRWRLIMNHNVNRLMIGQLDVDLNDMEPQSLGLPSCRAAIDERMREVEASRALHLPDEVEG